MKKASLEPEPTQNFDYEPYRQIDPLVTSALWRPMETISKNALASWLLTPQPHLSIIASKYYLVEVAI